MKTLLKLLYISVYVLLIDTLQRHEPCTEYEHDYQLRISKPLTVENYEKY